MIPFHSIHSFELRKIRNLYLIHWCRCSSHTKWGTCVCDICGDWLDFWTTWYYQILSEIDVVKSKVDFHTVVTLFVWKIFFWQEITIFFSSYMLIVMHTHFSYMEVHKHTRIHSHLRSTLSDEEDENKFMHDKSLYQSTILIWHSFVMLWFSFHFFLNQLFLLFCLLRFIKYWGWLLLLCSLLLRSIIISSCFYLIQECLNKICKTFKNCLVFCCIN